MSEIPDDIMQAASRAYFDAFDENDQASIHAVLRNIGYAILHERQRQAEVMEEVRKVLEPFADVADAILAEAPVDAGYFSVFMDCEGKSWRLTTDQLRAARALLSKLEGR